MMKISVFLRRFEKIYSLCLLEHNGFFMDRVRGTSHYIFKRDEVMISITFPHGGRKSVAKYQLKDAIAAVDQFKADLDERIKHE